MVTRIIITTTTTAGTIHTGINQAATGSGTRIHTAVIQCLMPDTAGQATQIINLITHLIPIDPPITIILGAGPIVAIINNF